MQTGLGHVISKELREKFAQAKSVLVLTGAGVSAESGVPTFRGGGNTVVWKGMPFDVISSAGMLERDLPAVWEWFNYRRDLLAAAATGACARLAHAQDKPVQRPLRIGLVPDFAPVWWESKLSIFTQATINPSVSPIIVW